MNRKSGEADIEQLKARGEAQLRGYGLDEKFGKSIGKTRLIKLLLIFSGHRLVYMGEVDV